MTDKPSSCSLAMESEKEVCGFKDETQRKLQLEDSAPGNNGIQTPQVKEEQRIKHEEELLPVSDSDIIAVVVKSEESLQTEHREEPQGEDFRSETDAQIKPDTDKEQEPCSSSVHEENHQVQTRDRRSAAAEPSASEKSYSCLLCPKTFHYTTNLHQHLRTHAETKPYSCLVCEQTFTYKTNLDQHMRTHADRPFSCTVCDLTFTLERNLRTHMRRVHCVTESGGGSEGRQHQCSVCHQRFSRKYILQNHIRVHTGERPYSCSCCNKTFSHKTNLHSHMRTHTGEKPYSCSVCDKSFSEKGQLNKHVKTHSGKQPYSCSVCAETFGLSKALKAHVRTHTGVKPYCCSGCSKGFYDASSLMTHKRTHTGERPFSCSLCVKTFTQKVNLDRHMKTHTGERPYNCSVCAHTFMRKDYLDSHLKTHATEKPSRCLLSETEKKLQLLDSARECGFQSPSAAVQTPQIKQEPKKQSIKQEEEQLPVFVQDVIAVVVKSEEEFVQTHTH